MKLDTYKNINFITSILIIFSGVYLNIIPLDPVYIAFVISLISIIYFLISRKIKLYIDNTIKLNLIFVIYMIFILICKKSNIGTGVNAIMSIIYFFMCVNLLVNLEKNEIINISKWFIRLSTLLLIIECIIRLSNPILEQPGFYKYKFNSIMYLDSNFVGIFILCLIFFCLYLIIFNKTSNIIDMVILIILSILTLSRAAIISILACLIIVVLYLKNKEYIKSIKKKHIIYAVIIISLILSIIVCIFLNDPSFLTKFDIIYLTKDYLKTATISQILFGVGFGNTINYIGMGAHNIFVGYIIECGLIGLLTYIIFIMYVAYKTHWKTLLITIPFSIAGLSFANFATPFLYSIYAIIYVIECNLIKEKI